MDLGSGEGIHWLKRWVFSCFLSCGHSFASCTFGGTVLDNILGGRLPSFCLPFFWFFLVDCYMVHCPSFASFA
jgi:hypothetical protein